MEGRRRKVCDEVVVEVSFLSCLQLGSRPIPGTAGRMLAARPAVVRQSSMLGNVQAYRT